MPSLYGGAEEVLIPGEIERTRLDVGRHKTDLDDELALNFARIEMAADERSLTLRCEKTRRIFLGVMRYSRLVLLNTNTPLPPDAWKSAYAAS